MSEIRLPEILDKDDIKKLPVHEREHYVKETVRKTINLNPNGVTTNQLARNLGFDIRAIDKHVSVMLHTNEIYTYNYDQTVVYLPNGKALHPIMAKDFKMDENQSLEIFQLKNRLGEFIYIQQKQNDDYRVDTGGGILIPIDKYPEFIEYMKQTLAELMRRR